MAVIAVCIRIMHDDKRSVYILQNVNDMQNEFKMKSQTDFTYVHKKLYSKTSEREREMNLCRVQLQKQCQ